MKDRTNTLPRAPHPVDNVHRVDPTVLESFPAGGPRGSWPAEEFAHQRRVEGLNVTVVMNIATDTFDVKQVTV